MTPKETISVLRRARGDGRHLPGFLHRNPCSCNHPCLDPELFRGSHPQDSALQGQGGTPGNVPLWKCWKTSGGGFPLEQSPRAHAGEVPAPSRRVQKRLYSVKKEEAEVEDLLPCSVRSLLPKAILPSLFPQAGLLLGLIVPSRRWLGAVVTMEVALQGSSGTSGAQSGLSAAFPAWHSPQLAPG